MSNASAGNQGVPSPNSFSWLSKPLFKSRFLKKPSWREQLNQADLPVEVKEIIRAVVLKSKLAAFEKSDVAADLISHFVDGKRHGRAYPAMAEDFGDPSVTATLIRRSKLRSRPLMYKIFRGMGIVAGMLLVSYLALLAFFHMGHPEPKIDFLIDWNKAVVETPDEEKAWPIYRAAWTAHNFGEGGGNRFDEIFVESDGNRFVQPFDDQWPEALAKLDESEDLLEAFRLGAKLPALGIVLQSDARLYSDEDFAALFPNQTKEDWSFDNAWSTESNRDPAITKMMEDSLVAILLPHVQQFRQAARIFHVDTRRAVVESDSERALSNIETTWGLAHHAAEGNCLVCALVGFAVANLGHQQLEEVLTADPDFFSEEQLERLQIAAEKIAPRQWLKYEGERAMVLDIVQRVYSDDGNGDGRMTSEGVKLLSEMQDWLGAGPHGFQDDTFTQVIRSARPVLAPVSMFVCASRKEVTDKCDEMFVQLSADKMLPFWEREESDMEQFIQDNPYRHMVLAALMPAGEQIRNAMDRTIGRQEGVIAALAIHRYYKKYDAWPEDYDQVSPEFVTEFPVDQFDGSLLKFKYDDNELLVYSIGRDFDDDGGAEHGTIHDGEFQQDESRAGMILGPKSDRHDGDWILWPQKGWE